MLSGVVIHNEDVGIIYSTLIMTIHRNSKYMYMIKDSVKTKMFKYQALDKNILKSNGHYQDIYYYIV